MATLTKTVFRFKEYKAYIRYVLEQEIRGEAAKLADAMKCQRSYLSQVLAGKPHLTADQAYLACRYWRFSKAEQEYFLGLLEIEKSLDQEYRSHLQNKLNELKKESEKLSQIVERPDVEEDQFRIRYYSSWIWQAVHFATSCPEFQTVDKISKGFKIPTRKVEEVLNALADGGYVTKERNQWKFAEGQKHLESNSPLLPAFHQSWRHKAAEDATMRSGTDLHFTGVQSLSRNDFEELKDLIRETLAKFHRKAGPSDPEIVVNINFDLWNLTEN